MQLDGLGHLIADKLHHNLYECCQPELIATHCLLCSGMDPSHCFYEAQPGSFLLFNLTTHAVVSFRLDLGQDPFQPFNCLGTETSGILKIPS